MSKWLKYCWYIVKSAWNFFGDFILLWSKIFIVSYFTFWSVKTYPEVSYERIAYYIMGFACISFFISYQFRGFGRNLIELIQWIKKERKLKNEQ